MTNEAVNPALVPCVPVPGRAAGPQALGAGGAVVPIAPPGGAEHPDRLRPVDAAGAQGRGPAAAMVPGVGLEPGGHARPPLRADAARDAALDQARGPRDQGHWSGAAGAFGLADRTADPVPVAAPRAPTAAQGFIAAAGPTAAPPARLRPAEAGVLPGMPPRAPLAMPIRPPRGRGAGLSALAMAAGGAARPATRDLATAGLVRPRAPNPAACTAARDEGAGPGAGLLGDSGEGAGPRAAAHDARENDAPDHHAPAHHAADQLGPDQLAPDLPARAPHKPARRATGVDGSTPLPPALGADRQTRAARVAAAGIAAGLAAGLIWLMAVALWPELGAQGAAGTGAGVVPTALGVALLGLFAVNTVWIAWAAAIALVGVAARTAAPCCAPRAGMQAHPRAHPPSQHPARTAILITLCGEPPAPVAAAAAALRRDLDAPAPGRDGPDTGIDIFLLSDTADPQAIALEEAALAPLARLPGILYRRRAERTGRKPGNIADWVRGWGAAYEVMAVLDADSRMTADRLRGLVARLDGDPGLGLVQSGMRLVPAASRFGAVQRLSARLCGPVVIAGLTALSGRTGNFWGHNAVIRVAAFADAAGLPRLPGRAPFGGEILSHDFIEAAWLARAGWGVAIDPDGRGSFEDAPQTLATFHRRDRRWCQGNLQHLRLLLGARMAGASRVHLLSGVQSYLSAPIWLCMVGLVALAGPGLAPGAAAGALGGALALLMVPKLAGAVALMRRNPRLRRRPGLVLRALCAETLLTTLLAPLVLVHQSGAVLAVLAGRDCGWTPAAARPGVARALARVPRGAPEAGVGAALIAGALLIGAGFGPDVGPDTALWGGGVGSGLAAAAWLLPLAGPLLAAPALVRWLDAPRRKRGPVGARADATTGAQRPGPPSGATPSAPQRAARKAPVSPSRRAA